MKYTRKPTTVEAFQFNPDGIPAYEWNGQFKGVAPTSYSEVHSLLGTTGCSKEDPFWNWDRMGTVVTIHGQVTIVVPGDYIVTEPDGIHHYPIKPDLFEQIYSSQESGVTSLEHDTEMPIEDAINLMIKENKVDTNLISDGYHTFGELYAHRIQLYIALCRELAENPAHQYTQIWKSKAHSDGSTMEGWFVMGISRTGVGRNSDITYHLPMSKWYECEFAPTLEQAPTWDGHTSADVLIRLKTL